MNKRGQFFLIAAIIIVGIVIGLSRIVNSGLERNENDPFFELSDEIKFETKQVLDYGVYNEEDTHALTESFLEQYADLIAQDKVVFIFGNVGFLQGIFFQNLNIGSVGIATGGTPTTIPIDSILGEEPTVTEDTANGVVLVTLDSITYSFPLKEGQNFFFVISERQDEEKLVASG